MVTIGVDQSLSNSALHEHISLENIKNYTKIQANVMINRSTKLFLENQWSQILKDVLKIVQ